MRRSIIPLLMLLCPAGLFVACYGRAIVQGEQFAYRDAAHYYYPLHQRVQAEWHAGRWPLWEPEENSGMPLLGNPTAAVLYPGKLVFALFPYPLAARLFVMGHTVLALAAMVALLRHWGTSWVGSILGSMAYAFGGPVLFQHCNIIYLVGAAWLPLGFRAVDRWLRLGQRIALAELAVILAMEILGGDPESAYLTGLCAAAYAAALAWRQGRRSDAGTDGAPPASRRGQILAALLSALLLVTLWVVATLAVAWWVPVYRQAPLAQGRQRSLPWTPWVGPAVMTAWGLAAVAFVAHWRRVRRAGARPILVPMLCGLMVAAVVAAALSAAQLLPVLEFTAQSGRAAEDGPHDIYPFSLHLVRVVEFVWPNIFGTSYHGNKLWRAAVPLPGTDAPVWVPTLYLGGLTLVLFLGGTGLRSARESTPWWTWMAVVTMVSLLGSFGEYGSPVWFARLVPGAELLIGPHNVTDASTRSSRYIRDGDGGVYWLLATGLPGFSQFRYPSKLLTFTVLGIASLAAQRWDVLASGEPRTRRRVAAWSGFLLVLTLAALALCIGGRAEFHTWLETQHLTSMFGPFDAPGAIVETRDGLVQAALVLAAALVLSLRLAGHRPVMAAALALVVTTVDLAVANSHVVITAPQSVFDSVPEVVSAIERAERDRPKPGPYRVHRVPIWSPLDWAETTSQNRVGDFVHWERQTAEPKYGINFGVHYTNTIGVAQLYDYEWFFGAFPFRARDKAARMLRVKPGTELVVYSRRAFDVWNSRYFILPYYPRWDDEYRGIASFIDRTERIVPPRDAFEGPDGVDRALAWLKKHDYQVRRNLDEYPRAWVVHDSRSMPAFRGLSRASRDLPMQEILFSNDMTWPDPGRVSYDPRRYVWLEDSVRPGLAAYLSGGETSTGEAVHIVHYQPDRVELQAVLERPGIVVLADAYYPGWTLTIDGLAAPVYRANRMMRGAAVAAGRHTLVYGFRPASFRIGLVVTGLGFAALGILAVWGLKK
jgi:hypothetical protein